ncbi:MAG: PTS sugar transporter subunit IIA [Robiginitomaculum sp.]
MIGLVIVTHGNLALELLRAAQHVVGPLPHTGTVCIGPDDNMERRRDDIRDAASDADSGKGVILLTDMFGGTPSNLAISLLKPGHIEVIAGVNLPMLIKLAEARRSHDLMSAAQKAKEAGQRYIAIASEILGGG